MFFKIFCGTVFEGNESGSSTFVRAFLLDAACEAREAFRFAIRAAGVEVGGCGVACLVVGPGLRCECNRTSAHERRVGALRRPNRAIACVTLREPEPCYPGSSVDWLDQQHKRIVEPHTPEQIRLRMLPNL